MSRRGKRSLFHRRQRRPLVALYRCGLHAVEGTLRANRCDASREAQRLAKVEPVHPDQYLAQIVRWKDQQIAEFRDHRNEEIGRLASESLIINAKASFLNEHEIVSEGRRYQFDAAIIASGSATTLPKIPGLDLSWDGVWTSDEILHNTQIPKSLAIVGAGAIGTEFSLRYERLGSQVTVVTRGRLLAGTRADSESDSRRFISRKVFVF